MAVKSRSKMSAHDPLSTGVGMAQQRFENEVSLPNEHDDDAQLFANIGKAAGPKPRGWRALAAGLAQGAEYGAKTKSTAKKQEALSKYDKVLDYFEGVNNAAMERKAWYEKKQFAEDKYLPDVLAYQRSAGELSPTNRLLMLRRISDGYNGIMETDYQPISVDGSDPNLVTWKSAKEGTFLRDIREMMAGTDVNRSEMAMSTSRYMIEQQKKEEKLAKEQDFKQQDLDIKKYEKGIKGGQFGTARSSQGGQDYGSIPLAVMKGKGTTQFMNTINSESNLAKEAPIILGMLEEGKKIINDHPKLGTAWANLVGPGNASRSLLGEKDRSAYEKLRKVSSRIAEAIIKAKGSAITDSERHTIEKGLFDVSLTAGANEYNIKSIEKELKIAKLRGDFAAKELARGYIATSESFDNYIKENPELMKPKPVEKMYTLRTPDGKTWPNIPESQLDAAIAATDGEAEVVE